MEASVVFIVAISVGGFYFVVIFLAYVFMAGRNRRRQIEMELQTRMLDKFSTAPEFIDFLSSPAGKQFVSKFEEAPRWQARERILVGSGRALILGVLGLGFLAINLFPETRDSGFIIAGCILLALGLGYMGASIAAVKLSRSWGLIPAAGERETATP